MSRAERRREKRDRVGAKDASRGPALSRLFPWVALGLFVAVAIGVWKGSAPGGGIDHPDPRPDATAEGMMPASRYAGYARVSAVYAQAAEVPAVLDGLYCYCYCGQHSGHRSLLSCFESDHAAACDVCLSEAAIAFQMNREGKTLAETRAAIDDLYGA